MRLKCQLRPLREQQGLHLRDMQERTGIHRGTLSRIERGMQLPTRAQERVLEQHYQLVSIRDAYQAAHVLAVEFEEQ